MKYFKNPLIFTMCIMFMTSCSLFDKLGFDTYDYMSEDVRTIHATDGEAAKKWLIFLM